MPLQNRPREKFLKYDAGVLNDAELFAIILKVGTIGENPADLASNLPTIFKKSFCTRVSIYTLIHMNRDVFS